MPEPAPPNVPESAAPPPPPRFRWPMRFFLFVLLLNIAFRSLSVLLPGDEWRQELNMDEFPRRLPTPAEFRDWDPQTSPGQLSLAEDVMRSLDSVWDFLKPWPDAAARARIGSWGQRGKFAFCWLNTRFAFLENLLGVNQEWPMFSPNVSQQKGLARSQLVFADGSRRTVRLTADPEDLTRYAHWFQEKVLDYELKVRRDPAVRLGYANLLAHRFPRNENGSPLVRIYFYQVWYYFPGPHQHATDPPADASWFERTRHYFFPDPALDAARHLREQSGPPPSQVEPPFCGYDVAGRREFDLGQARRRERDVFAAAGLCPGPGAPLALALAGWLQDEPQKALYHLDP